MSSNELAFEMPCTLDAVRGAADSVEEAMRAIGVPDSALLLWKIALVEALNNAVIHTPPEARKRPVGIGMERTPEGLRVRIRDHSPGFDLPDLPDLPEPESESGRGLFLIRNSTHRMTYLRGPSGNVMELVRNDLPPQVAIVAKPMPAENLEETLALMTEELASCYETLSAIFSFSELLARSDSMAQFTQAWLDELKRIVGADYYLLREYTVRDGTRLEVVLQSPEDATLPQDAVVGPDSASVEVSALAERSDTWFDTNAPLHHDDPLHGPCKGLCGICHPIFAGQAPFGTLTVASRKVRDPFTAGQVSCIQTFADFLAIKLRAAREREATTRARVVQRELEIAASIQKSLLPVDLPSIPGYKLVAQSISASQIGGDFFEVLPAKGGVLFAVADVMGKGVSAALFAAIFRSQLRSHPELLAEPAQLMKRIAQSMFDDLDRVEMFVTAQIAWLEPSTGRVRLASAGHIPPLFSMAGKGSLEQYNGVPLGVDAEADYPQAELGLQPGERMLLLTDGLFEVVNAKGEMLGIGPIQDWMQLSLSCGPTTKMDLNRLLDDFRGDVPQRDDATYILVARDSD